MFDLRALPQKKSPSSSARESEPGRTEVAIVSHGPSFRAVFLVGVAAGLLAIPRPAGAQPFFGTPVPIGEAVDGDSWNAGGSMTEDLRQLFFFSERAGGVGNLDIWVAKRESTDVPFGEPENLGRPVNSDGSEGAPYVTPDGLELYFCSTRPEWHLDLWLATRERPEGPFGEPVRLPEPVSSADAEEKMGCISSDRLQLWYFLDDGFRSDLRVAVRESRDQDWSESVVLDPGEELNAFDARYPRLSADGTWLFFSDDRPPQGQGGDLWLSRRDDPTDPLGFGVPENLEAINSLHDDRCPWISPDGKWLLFASRRLGTGGYDHLLVEVFNSPAPALVTREIQTALSPEEHCGDFQELDEIPVVLSVSDIRQDGDTWSAPTSVKVREVAPAGWGVLDISGGGVETGEAIEWTLSGDSLGEGTPLSYRVRADTSDVTVSFDGTVEEDLGGGEIGYPHPIVGETTIIRNTPFDVCGGIRCWNILGAIRQPFGAPTEENIRRDFLTDGTQTELEFLFEPGATISPAFSSQSAGTGIHEDTLGRNPNRQAGEMEVFAWNDPDSFIDLNDVIFGGNPDLVMAYAQAYITAEQEMDAFLDVSSDEAIQVILNEEEVHINTIRREGSDDCHPLDVAIPVHLLSGENSLLVKTFEKWGLWNFALRFSNDAGEPITEGLQVWKTPSADICRDAPFTATRLVGTGQSVLIGNEMRRAWNELGGSFTVTVELSDIREEVPPCGPPSEVTLVEIVPLDWTARDPSHGGTIRGDTVTWHLAIGGGGGGGLPQSLSYTVETGGDLIDVEFAGTVAEPGGAGFRIVGDREVVFLPPRLPRGAGEVVIDNDFDEHDVEAECPDGWTCNAPAGFLRFDPGVTQLAGHEGRLRLACGDRDGDGAADAFCAARATSVIWNEPIDLSEHSFVAEFDVYFSFREGGLPADGMTFCVLDADVNAMTSLGMGGGFLGYGGLSGFAVELDLFRNGWDPSGYDDQIRPCGHVGLVRDGLFVPHVQTHLDLDPGMFPEVLGGNGFPEFVDLGGTGFPLHVQVDYNNGRVQVHLSAPESGDEPAFGPTKVIDTLVTFPVLLDFGAELPVLQAGFIGFTAGTGIAYADHEVDNVVVTLYEEGSAAEICDNGRDDDGDGEVDCQDRDCSVVIECEGEFVRGDANADDSVDIADGIFVLNFLFLGGDAPPCLEAANSSGGGGVDISDGVYLLNFLFLGGPEPPAPYPDCGRPAGDTLGCESFPPCP